MKTLIRGRGLVSPLQPDWCGRAVLIGLQAILCLSVACSRQTQAASSKAEINHVPGVYDVEHPGLFKLAVVGMRALPVELTANGSVNPDAMRTIHVTSLAAGRVVDLRVRLGDFVKKGQVLVLISSPDLSTAAANYEKAEADEDLAHKDLERSQMLYAHGALAQKDLQLAQDTEDKALVDVQTAAQQIRLLGGDPAHPGQLVELRAPVSGTIVEQNIAGAEGIKSLDNTPNLFTIADLSDVWVLCDVYENDLREVHTGDAAEIRLNAFPGEVFHGRVANISRVLDPETRAAKVRIVLPNPDGEMSPGMFAVATFHSHKLHNQIVVPATAVMRLQDKDWVFRSEGGGRFRRLEVQVSGETSDGMQELERGVQPGDQIVRNALEFSAAVAEQGK